MSDVRWMLDTNAVSAFMHSRSRQLDREVAKRVPGELCVSSISYGETLYGLANRPAAVHLAAAAERLFRIVDILPWTGEVALRYGPLRASLRRVGVTLQPLDLLIAAHALSVGATLITADAAFRMVPDLRVEDWSG